MHQLHAPPSPCTLSPQRGRGGKGLRRLNGASPSKLVGGAGLEPPAVGRRDPRLPIAAGAPKGILRRGSLLGGPIPSESSPYHPGGLTSPHIPPEVAGSFPNYTPAWQGPSNNKLRGTLPRWWAVLDLNQRPHACEACALTTELTARLNELY